MSVSLKQSYDIEYDGTANVARMDLFADTAGDLTGLTTVDGITLLQGSTAEDISTGDVYMMKTDGTWVKQPSQSAFANVYTKAEIDSMLYLYYTKVEADALFEWITVTLTTDTLPLEFIADGTPLISWSMKGNGSQQGTPTPDNPVMPEFVGTLSDADWTIPITCAGQTTPVYLGEVPTVRRVKKQVFTGEEDVGNAGGNAPYSMSLTDVGKYDGSNIVTWKCSHYEAVPNNASWATYNSCISVAAVQTISGTMIGIRFRDTSCATVDAFKQFLSEQYAAGTPVTVWYVLSTEQTGIVNDPLCKIGTYADELHSEDAGVSIPTAKGQNTLTVDTELQPSEITITGKIREVTENEQ